MDSVQSKDGVVILFDMGSAIMTTEMVLEEFQGVNIKMVDAPIVEGSIAAAISSAIGLPIDQVIQAAKEAGSLPKLQ